MSLNYPYEIIQFVYKYDVPPILIPVAYRYQELMLKDNLTITPAEIEELNTLAIQLEPYNITATDYNKLFKTVEELRTFITTDLQTYLNVLFDGYNTKMDTMENGFSIRTTEIDGWYNNVRMTLYDDKYFDFDNEAYRGGFNKEITIEKSPFKSVEMLINRETSEIYASRLTTRDGNVWTKITVCESKNINVTNTITKLSNGNYIEVTVDNNSNISQV